MRIKLKIFPTEEEIENLKPPTKEEEKLLKFVKRIKRKPTCKKCGVKMEIFEGHADLCYDCDCYDCDHKEVIQ